MTTSKINTGIYKITNQGKTFEARKNEVHGQWELFQIVSDLIGGTKEEYCQTYTTLSSCKIVTSDKYINEYQ